MHQRSKVCNAIVLTALILTALTATTRSSGELVLIGGSPNGTIYDVSTTTGLASNPRETGITDLSALAFDLEGVLYAAGADEEGIGNALYTVNPATGVAQRVGGLVFGTRDFEYSPSLSVLLAVMAPQGGGTSLYRIDAESGTAVNVGPLEAISASLAVSPLGNIYLLEDRFDELLEINPSDGATLRQLALDVSFGTTGSVFLDERTLFAVDGAAPSAHRSLFRIDVLTGNIDEIGNTGLTSGLTSLALVPEPTSLVLMALVLAMLLLRN